MAARDIVELFGFDPLDLSDASARAWAMRGCPFTGTQCSKTNHDKSIVYGVCTVSYAQHNVVICPKRFYGRNHALIRSLAEGIFGQVPVLDFREYLERGSSLVRHVVLIGQGSGREVSAGNMSMDWVAACVENGRLLDYAVIEVQSIDTTGNYRACWEGHRSRRAGNPSKAVKGGFGLNFANVHKRILPQLLRKSSLLQVSSRGTKGIMLVVPDVVYERFEPVIEASTLVAHQDLTKDSITFVTYALGGLIAEGVHRELVQVRRCTFRYADVAERFVRSIGRDVQGELDRAVSNALSISQHNAD